MDYLKVYASLRIFLRKLITIILQFFNDNHMKLGLNKCRELYLERRVANMESGLDNKAINAINTYVLP